METSHSDKIVNKSVSGNIKIFTCNANKDLATKIASKLGIQLGQSEVLSFSDGETYTRIHETVRGADVYIVQPTSPPVNDNLMELLIMVDAMRRASAGTINAVIPYFGYARQDRKARARDPISAKLVANLIAVAGVDRVVAMDLHCPQIQGFFDIPVDHLLGIPIITEYYNKKFNGGISDVVVVSPDLGSIARARALAKKIHAPLAIIDKRRTKVNEAEVMNIIGDVSGKRIVLADDMIDTAGTITGGAAALKAQGAAEIYAFCTHAVLSGSAIERIQNSPIKELLVLDTIPLPKEKHIEKIKVLSVADMFAEAIYRIHNGESVSTLFD